MPKSILITGASAGLGQSTANYFVKKGFLVFGTSRKCVSGELKDGIHWVRLDLTSEESTLEAVIYLKSQLNSLDVLLNNAGAGMVASICDTDRDSWRTVFETNLFGPMQLVRRLYPLLKAAQGKVINIGSIASEFGLPYRGAYSSVKAAFEIASESLMLELNPMGVDVHVIQPGDFATNINNNRVVAKDIHPDFKETHQKIHTLINQHVTDGLNPLDMAKYIHNIAVRKEAKFKTRVASPIQSLSPWLKRLLPQKVFSNLLLKHYKLK